MFYQNKVAYTKNIFTFAHNNYVRNCQDDIKVVS